MTDKGRHGWQVWLCVALAATLVLLACGRGPKKPPVAPLPPPPPSLTPKESALERAVAEFFGSPYRSGGTSPAGVDCSGLVMVAFKRVGLALPRTAAQQ